MLEIRHYASTDDLVVARKLMSSYAEVSCQSLYQLCHRFKNNLYIYQKEKICGMVLHFRSENKHGAVCLFHNGVTVTPEDEKSMTKQITVAFHAEPIFVDTVFIKE